MDELTKKKNYFFICILLAIVILVGAFCIYKFVFSKENKTSSLISISVNDLENKMQNKETFIIVFSQTGCPHCEQYIPELDRALKDVGIKAYLLNLTDISDEDSANLGKYVHFSGTPTTVFFTDGEEKTSLNRIVGYASKSKIIERIKSLGYID